MDTPFVLPANSELNQLPNLGLGFWFTVYALMPHPFLPGVEPPMWMIHREGYFYHTEVSGTPLTNPGAGDGEYDVKYFFANGNKVETVTASYANKYNLKFVRSLSVPKLR